MARNTGVVGSVARRGCVWRACARLDHGAAVDVARVEIATARQCEYFLVVASAWSDCNAVDCRKYFTGRYVEHGIWRIRRA